MSSLTSSTDTDLYLVSMLDIDTIISISQINKNIRLTIQKSNIYQQFILYKNNRAENNIFKFACLNNYVYGSIRLQI